MRKSTVISLLTMMTITMHALGQQPIVNDKNNISEKRFAVVRQSVLTGLDLPAGTRRSFGGDSLTLAKNLLQQRVSSSKGKVGNIEILNTNCDSVVARLVKSGWKIAPDSDDK